MLATEARSEQSKYAQLTHGAQRHRRAGSAVGFHSSLVLGESGNIICSFSHHHLVPVSVLAPARHPQPARYHCSPGSLHRHLPNHGHYNVDKPSLPRASHVEYVVDRYCPASSADEVRNGRSSTSLIIAPLGKGAINHLFMVSSGTSNVFMLWAWGSRRLTYSVLWLSPADVMRISQRRTCWHARSRSPANT